MSYTGKTLLPYKGSFPLNLYTDNFNESGITPPPPLPSYLLLEDGAFILLENDGFLELE